MDNFQHYGGVRTAQNFMYKVYAWMTGGLALTAGVAYYVAHNQVLFNMFMRSGLMLGLIVLQAALVIALAAFINRMNFAVALSVFAAYAATLGVSLSSLFHVYHLGSLYVVFGITAGTFAVMAIYGYVTKADLTNFGSIALMALIGIILASFINMFVKSSAVEYAISFIGVLVFAGLTAYDMQKIKELGQEMAYHQESTNKIAVIGALTLYLDFINLFLHMVRLLGKRKD